MSHSDVASAVRVRQRAANKHQQLRQSVRTALELRDAGMTCTLVFHPRRTLTRLPCGHIGQ
jgi:hypothetical protein